ncbi:MAG: WxL domain-containing protein [Lactobacillales bacterium]|nr:WxL domain-containing protein [Lactobacillales bacterium]
MNWEKWSIGLSLLIVGSSMYGMDVSSETTETTVQLALVEEDGKGEPVDPNIPSKPLPDVPEGNTETGNTGTLKLVVIPKEFNFGKILIYSQEKIYSANTNQTQYLQVSDTREPSKVGWSVTVKQDGDLKSTDGQSVLTGAILTVPCGIVRNSQVEKPSESTSTLQSQAVNVNTSEQTIFETALQENGVGKGDSTNSFEGTQVKLKIPKGVGKLGTFSNTLTWTLTAKVTQ